MAGLCLGAHNICNNAGEAPMEAHLKRGSLSSSRRSRYARGSHQFGGDTPARRPTGKAPCRARDTRAHLNARQRSQRALDRGGAGGASHAANRYHHHLWVRQAGAVSRHSREWGGGRGPREGGQQGRRGGCARLAPPHALSLEIGYAPGGPPRLLSCCLRLAAAAAHSASAARLTAGCARPAPARPARWPALLPIPLTRGPQATLLPLPRSARPPVRGGMGVGAWAGGLGRRAPSRSTDPPVGGRREGTAKPL